MANSQIREIDSLKNLLATKMKDTARVMALVQLSFFTTDLDSSLKLDNESLMLARKINFRRGEAASLNQFCNDFLGISNYPKALECVLQSLQINESIGDMTQLARNYSNIGRIYSSQNDHTNALYYFNKAIEIFNKTGSERVRIAYVSMGDVYEKMNRLDSALDYYQRSYMIFNSINDKYQLSFVLNALGNVHSKMNHTELAFTFYRMSIEASVPGSQYLPRSYYGLANLFKQTGKIDSCFYYVKKAMDASTGYREIIVKSSMLLSNLFEGKDDKQSFHFYKLATATRDSIYNSEKEIQIKNMSYNEQDRQRQLTEAESKTKEERKRNLQYAAIALGLITFIILFLLLSHSIVASQKLIKFLGILALLIVFELINLYIHPYLVNLTHHSPLLMLTIMVCIAALLIPLHHWLEKWITHRLVEKNKKIRLAAAKKTIIKLGGEQTN